MIGLLFIQKTGKSVLRSQNQNPQKAKIRSVTLQGAEGGLEKPRLRTQNSRLKTQNF